MNYEANKKEYKNTSEKNKKELLNKIIECLKESLDDYQNKAEKIFKIFLESEFFDLYCDDELKELLYEFGLLNG